MGRRTTRDVLEAVFTVRVRVDPNEPGQTATMGAVEEMIRGALEDEGVDGQRFDGVTVTAAPWRIAKIPIEVDGGESTE